MVMLYDNSGPNSSLVLYLINIVNNYIMSIFKTKLCWTNKTQELRSVHYPDSEVDTSIIDSHLSYPCSILVFSIGCL